jgi:hypothetical protein
MHIILLQLNNILKHKLLNVFHLSSEHQGAHNYINHLFNVTVSCMWQNCRRFLNVLYIYIYIYIYIYDNNKDNNNNNNNHNSPNIS